MKTGRLFLFVGCVVVTCVTWARAAEPNTLSEQELDDGWVLLFDGESTFGWQPTSDANWHVSDGVISVSKGSPGFLMTTSEFGDFELQVDFKAGADTNSGIFLRTAVDPKDPTTDCYELNIAAPGTKFPTGSFVRRERIDAVEASDDWRHFDITAIGGHFVVKLDGQPVLDYTDEHPLLRGRIGLQLYEGPVQFRNVKLKPLSLEPIFNGRDLSGWKTYPEMASRFSVTPEGELHVENGKGMLESEQSYGDFVLQWEVFVGGDSLNSGLFFRCLPGETMNGYECQIHNGFKDGDRTQPADGGTGGFYRRQPARKVMADDRTWFPMTLIATGPHMAAWVNGYQVSDWTDERAPDPNPRNGLRVEPGTLMIQGHDPTTNLSFRKLRAIELPTR